MKILAHGRRNMIKAMDQEHLDAVTPADSPQNAPMELTCLETKFLHKNIHYVRVRQGPIGPGLAV